MFYQNALHLTRMHWATDKTKAEELRRTVSVFPCRIEFHEKGEWCRFSSSNSILHDFCVRFRASILKFPESGQSRLFSFFLSFLFFLSFFLSLARAVQMLCFSGFLVVFFLFVLCHPWVWGVWADTPDKRDARLDAKEREKYKRMRPTPGCPKIRDNSVVWINSVDGRTKTGAQTGRTPKSHYERIAFGQIFEYIKCQGRTKLPLKSLGKKNSICATFVISAKTFMNYFKVIDKISK